MTMTSTYDHRVIQGAESGAFLRRIEELLQGDDGFYEEVFREPRPRDARRAAGRGAAARGRARRRAPSEEMLSHVQAATSLVKAHRMHGHLAARLDPLGSEPIGDPALEPATVGLTPEVMEQIPAAHPADPGARARRSPRRCRTCARPTAARSPTRSSTSPTTSSACGCGSGSSRASTAGRCRPRRRSGSCSRLTEAEALETYIHRAFLGAKSFSIEGLDALIPMLDETFELAARRGRARGVHRAWRTAAG